MPKTNTNSAINIFNVLKFVWGVAIFYFWLKLFVPTTFHEDFVSTNMYEWLETELSDNMYQDMRDIMWNHEVASVDRDLGQYEGIYPDTQDIEYASLYQNICTTNSIFCRKMNFNGEYDIKDKYMYLASTIYILRFIEDNIQVWLPLAKSLDTIVVNDVRNTRRWYANWNTVTLNLGSVLSYAEFMELVSHELWHIVDLWLVRWYSLQKDVDYTEFGNAVFPVDDPSISYYEISWDSENIRKETASVADFCSSYGMSDPFEDFAECHNLYLNHNAIFKVWAQNNEMMKKKYNFFANLYGWKFLFSSTVDLWKYSAAVNSRPWDTTRM